MRGTQMMLCAVALAGIAASVCAQTQPAVRQRQRDQLREIEPPRDGVRQERGGRDRAADRAASPAAREDSQPAETGDRFRDRLRDRQDPGVRADAPGARGARAVAPAQGRDRALPPRADRAPRGVQRALAEPGACPCCGQLLPRRWITGDDRPRTFAPDGRGRAPMALPPAARAGPRVDADSADRPAPRAARRDAAPAPGEALRRLQPGQGPQGAPDPRAAQRRPGRGPAGAVPLPAPDAQADAARRIRDRAEQLRERYAPQASPPARDQRDVKRGRGRRGTL